VSLGKRVRVKGMLGEGTNLLDEYRGLTDWRRKTVIGESLLLSLSSLAPD
jgi:hypothetical protein